MKNCYIVTGTTSGLGLAFIKQLVAEKHLVYSISRKTNTTIEELFENHFFQHLECDLADENTLRKTFLTIIEDLKAKEIKGLTLINNAGTINPIGNVGKTDLSLLSNSIDTNIKAPILLSELFIAFAQPLSINKSILNISSGAGRKPYAGWATYCAAKAGLDLFTQCIGVEQAEEKHPIKVISFAPGVVDTNMQDKIRSAPKETFGSVSRFIDLKENNQLLPAPFVAHKLLELLHSNKTASGELYDIRDFIQEKQ